KRDADTVRALLKSGLGPDFNFNDLYPRGRTYESPLTMAMNRGHLEIARVLLEGGADPNRRDASGRAPIHQAKTAGAVALLARAGADLNAQDGQGRTAVALALERGDLAQTDALAAAGARLDAPVKGADLFTRALETKRPELVAQMLERGVDPRSPPTK